MQGADVVTLNATMGVPSAALKGVGDVGFSMGIVEMVVVAVNDPPTINTPNSYVAHEGVWLATNGIVIDDVDVKDTSGAWLDVVLSLEQVGGTIDTSRKNINGLYIHTVATESETKSKADSKTVLKWSGSVKALNLGLKHLRYKSVQGYSGTDHLTVTVMDHGNTGAGGNQSTSISIPIEVTSIDNVPVLRRKTNAPFENGESDTVGINSNGCSVSGGDSTTQEDTSVKMGCIEVEDQDSEGVGHDASTLKVVVTAQHGNLHVHKISHWVTTIGNGTAALTLSGPVLDVNATLSSISYMPSLHYHGLDTLTYTLPEHSGTTREIEVRLRVLPVNDPPSFVTENENVKDLSYTTLEDVPLTGFPNIAVTDVDNTVGQGSRSALTDGPNAVVQVSVRVSNGTLKMNTNVVRGLQFVTPSMEAGTAYDVSFIGTPAHVNDALQYGLVYTPVLDWSGTATLDINVSDVGHALNTPMELNLHSYTR